MGWHLVSVFHLLTSQIVCAYHLQIRGLPTIALFNVTKQDSSQNTGATKLNNSADISYYAEITLGNQTFTVLIDTGSSDLWVAGSVIQSTISGQNTTIKYAANSVTGPVKYASVDFAGQKVVNQAFLEVAPDTKNDEGLGILGLGPGSGSFLARTLPSTGTSILDRIFAQNSSSANFFTILLDRSSDPTPTFEGIITVGEVIPEFRSILDHPRLAITSVPDGNLVDQHLQILLDPNGIIGPDGQAIPTRTLVEQTENQDQMTVVLDSGFTLPQLPRPIVDKIYSPFRDSEFREVPGIGGVYVLPCEQEVNITLMFAGRSYPVHPLDMALDPSSIYLPALRTPQGQNACIGTFQPFSYSRGSNPNYDIVLGMAFLRNVYTLFDYGAFVKNSTTPQDSYVQMLSITEQAEAHRDFVSLRLGGVDTTGNLGLISTNSGSGNRKTTYYIVAGVIVAVFLFVLAILLTLRTRNRR